MNHYDKWHDGVPCGLCEEPIDTANQDWHSIDRYGDIAVHDECDRKKLAEVIQKLKQDLYTAEAVCWAKYRVEELGQKAKDPEFEKNNLKAKWKRWKEQHGQ